MTDTPTHTAPALPLAELRELYDAADVHTPLERIREYASGLCIVNDAEDTQFAEAHYNDANLIVAAVNALPALLRAAERSAQSGWRSVRDELPEAGEMVVVQDQRGDIEFAWNANGGWEFRRAIMDHIDYPWWMPLPALPSEEPTDV
jgi:hypothetical protein